MKGTQVGWGGGGIEGGRDIGRSNFPLPSTPVIALSLAGLSPDACFFTCFS